VLRSQREVKRPCYSESEPGQHMFACVTRLQATLRLASFYYKCNYSRNVIIRIHKVNLLVNRNTRVNVQIVHILEFFYLKKSSAYL
jgi:hypothetical protein